MNIETVDSCCTARILSGFGKATAAMDPEDYGDDDIPMTKEALLNEMLDNKRKGFAVVMGFTNNKQHAGNKLLREVGFKRTKWMSKTQHPETKLRMWWFQLDQLEA
jgi:hypothetical protein